MANNFTRLYIANTVASGSNKVWKKLSTTLQLPVPTLSLDGDTLTITDNSGLAERVSILVDGEAKGVTDRATFDLSLLELAEGTYSITAIAKANGYIDSAESEAVSYEVAAAEDALAGTWVFNDTLTPDTLFRAIMSLECNGVTYTGMFLKVSPTLYYLGDNQVGVYGLNGWNDEAYKTITISSNIDEVTFYNNIGDVETLLAWLQANATKQ